jgi:hypothetical protein
VLTKHFHFVPTRAISASLAAAARAEAEKQWFESAINDIHEGLNMANRFTAESRHARAVLAFGQLELLSRRWFDTGWTALIPQEISIDLLVDNWCWLLGAE